MSRGELDRAIAACGLTFRAIGAPAFRGGGRIDIDVRRFKDFHPDALVSSHPELSVLLEARDFVRDAPARGLSEDAIRRRLREIPNLPVVFEPPPPAGASPEKSAIDSILDAVALPQGVPAPAGGIRSIITQIEAVLQGILRDVFSDGDFRAVESSWRGVNTLLQQGIGDGEIGLTLVPATLETLEKTLEDLVVACAADLPSLVLVDLPFDATPARVALLEKVALFAETLVVPVVCTGAPGVLGVDSWAELSKLPFLPHRLDEAEFAKLRRLQRQPAARWVALACNPFMVRAPYGPDNKPSRIRFDEPEGLFASPAWAAGTLVAQSVRRHGWPSRFTEWTQIRLENLPLREWERGHRIPTGTAIAEDRLRQFAQAGLLPLASALDKDFAFAPFEATLGRGSLRRQLVLSQVARLLLWCRDNLSPDLAGEDLEAAVRQAFGAWWEKTGQPPPAALRVTAAPGDGGKPGSLGIVLDPSREILPTGERIELSLPW